MWKKIETDGRNFLREVLAPFAIRALRRKAERVSTAEEIVGLAVNFRCFGIKIRPSQIPSEIQALLELLAKRPPQTVLELGTHKGGTFFMLSRIATPDAFLISLDLPPGELGGYTPWQGRIFRSFARDRQRIELVMADSHQYSTLEQARQLLGQKPLDFLLIDGDHNYAGVRKDFELYSTLVRPGGLIAFHDIVPGPAERVGGVPQFWQEIKRDRPVKEFVADWKQGGFGIGVFEVGAA